MRINPIILAGLLLTRWAAAAPATQPSAVTLRLQDARPQAIIDAFNRQSRLQLKLAEQESLPAKVSIDVDGLTPLLALREVCARLNASPSVSGEPDTLVLEADDTFVKRPFAAAGPLMVVADSIEHSTSIRACGQEATSTLEMSLTALIDPTLRVLAHHPEIRITEAADERGNSLVLKKPAEEQAAEADDLHLDAASASMIQVDLTATLAYPPKDAGRQIARLKASVRAQVLERSERWELGEVMKAREQTKSAAGVRYVLNSVTMKQENCRVQVTLHRETAGDEQWRLGNLALPMMLRLLDGKGKAMVFGGVEDQEQDARKCRYTLAYSAPEPEAQRPAAPPAKLVWELPLEVKEVELPFEMRDVPMP